MKSVGIALVALALAAWVQLGWAAPEDEFPPDEFQPGWRGSAITKARTPRELFDYMDGGAELYLEYHFRRLHVREYHHADDGDITVEIWQFEQPDDACGVFSLDATGVPLEIGQEGRGPDSSQMGAVRFWQGDRFVRIFSWQGGMGAILRAAAKSIAERLPPGDSLSDWLSSLRKGGLHPIFVRGEIALRAAAGTAAPDVSAIPLRAGAAWIASQPQLPAACLIIHSADEKGAEDLYHKIGSLGGTRSVRSDTIAGSAERLGREVIWVAAEKDEAACVKTLDKIKTILQPEGEP